MTKRILGLRTVDCNRRSWCGFQWPSSGKVVAPDWNPEPICGGGLHALIWGMGDGELLKWDESAIWQAVWVDPDKVVYIGDDKAKFPECEIAIDGTREQVIKFMVENGADATEIVGGVVIGRKFAVANGHRGNATAVSENAAHATANGTDGCATANGVFSFAVANGKGGMAVANGDRGQAIAGGHATANGYYGIAVADAYRGVAHAGGQGGMATANGEHGVAVANGLSGRATANGPHGIAKANGESGIATANGYSGQAFAKEGIAFACGDLGYAHAAHAHSAYKASAPLGGAITITCQEGKYNRVVTGYVGENGIVPDTIYVVKDGKLVPISSLYQGCDI